MTKQQHNRVYYQMLLKKGVGLLSGLSLLSSSLVVAQTTSGQNSFVIPMSPSAPAPQSAAPVAPPALSKAPKSKAVVRSSPAVQPRVTRSNVTPKRTASQAQLSAPRVTLPRTTEAPLNINRIISEQRTSNRSSQGQNNYLDPNQYQTEVKPENSPARVVLTARNTGCNTIVLNGQLKQNCGAIATNSSNSNTAHTSSSSVARVRHQPASIAQQYNTVPLRIASNITRDKVPNPLRYYNSNNRNISYRAVGSGNNGEPYAVAPIYNRATINQQLVNSGKTALLFPVSIPASITSAFGFRIHPISGSRRMHSGTDIGAPMGTPVLAAYPGTVEVASNMQGYGLIVIVRHLDNTQESRYAHLSEIFVQPGEWVEQGRVIGLVGSTGNSTGPHLHFEWRHLTDEGWVAVDAGQHLEYAMDNLIRSLELAQKQTEVKPKG